MESTVDWTGWAQLTNDRYLQITLNWSVSALLAKWRNFFIFVSTHKLQLFKDGKKSLSNCSDWTVINASVWLYIFLVFSRLRAHLLVNWQLYWGRRIMLFGLMMCYRVWTTALLYARLSQDGGYYEMVSVQVVSGRHDIASWSSFVLPYWVFVYAHIIHVSHIFICCHACNMCSCAYNHRFFIISLIVIH